MEPNTPDITQLAPELVEVLDPAELAALEHGLAEADPRSVRALAHWVSARHQIAARLAEDLPPFELLVLYALSDQRTSLSDAELTRLEEARGQIEAALDDHPGLQTVVERIRADRDAFDTLWEQPSAAPPTRAADRAPVRPRTAPVSATRRWVWRAAAAAAVLLFGATLLMIVQRNAEFDTVRTAEGETRALTLPDGSHVQMGSSTSLAFDPRPRAERQVRLTGEALFEVVPGEAPFIVETQEARITVVGTTFGVTADISRTEVVLVSGVVDMASRIEPDTAVRLRAGERSRVFAGQRPERPQPTDVARALEWTGTWFFQTDALGEIAGRLEQHYDVHIEVPDAVAGERLTGAFPQDAPVEETLQTLATALGIGVEREAPGRFRFGSSPD